MAIGIQPRELEEVNSSGTSTPRAKYTSIIATIKTELSGDTSTVIHLPLSPTSLKKHGSNNLLSKFFYTLAKGPRSQITHDNTDLATVLGPATFLQPLKYKMEPRREPKFKRSAGPKVTSKHEPILIDDPADVSALAVHIHRQRAERILNGLESKDLKDTDLLDMLSKRSAELDRGSGKVDEEEAEDYVTKFVKNYHEYIAVSSALDERSVPKWRDYINCYTKGRFNLINPPFPPPHHEDFTFLPAMFPPNEARRNSAFRSMEATCEKWSEEEAKTFMQVAMDKFSTPFGAISFFDSEREIFQVEKGYGRPTISRTVSIAAHALLSDDVLVVLDAKKDWRFQHNPLITEQPKIGFFAAAPMLTDDGHSIGTLAIFDTISRDSFSVTERRQLAECSSRAMKDLTTELRCTPILERDSVINGDYRPVTPKTPTLQTANNYTCPDDLPFRQMKAPHPNYSTSFYGGQRSQEYGEQTPPTTASDDGRHLSSPHSGFGKNLKQLSLNSGLSTFPSLHDLITPDSRDFKIPSPRPFSASDITSLNIQPTNTPDNSLIEEPIAEEPYIKKTLDVTIEEFLALSDEDCSEDPDLPMPSHDTSIITASPPTDPSAPRIYDRPSQEIEGQHVENYENSIIPSSPLIDLSTPQTKPRLSEVKSACAACLQSLHSTTEPTDSSWSGSSEGKESKAEAAAACKFLSQSLGFDFVYVLEIYPKQSRASEAELLAPGGLVLRTLASHDPHEIERRFKLGPEVHLEAVRSRGCSQYTLEKAEYAVDEFPEGYIIPVSTEGGAVKARTHGVMLGAFRKPRREGEDTPTRNAKEDMSKLGRSVEDLKSVLLAGSRIQLQRALDDCVANPYPANEAREIGDYYLDGVKENELHERAFDDLESSFPYYRGQEPVCYEIPRNIRRDSPASRQHHSNSQSPRPAARSAPQQYIDYQLPRPESRSAHNGTRQCQFA